MKETNTGEYTDAQALVMLLEEHADESLKRSASNAKYAETVRMRSQDVQALITAQTGEVRGVAISWMDEIQPIVEIVFGEDLSGQTLGTFREYTPTIFDSIYGRTRILSTDEMLGPTVALDLAAEDSIKSS